MNILITGAGKGIGLELVKIFAENSTNNVIGLSRNVQALRKLSANNVLNIQADLIKCSQHDISTHLSKNKISNLDLVINNAAQLINKPFINLEIDDFRKLYEINVFAQIKMIKAVLPYLKKAKDPHVINITSMGAIQGSQKFKGLSAYSSSKSALVCLTECLAEEYKESNIKFNSFALGAVSTEMLKKAFPGYNAPVSASQMAQTIAKLSVEIHKVMNGKIIQIALSTP